MRAIAICCIFLASCAAKKSTSKVELSTKTDSSFVALQQLSSSIDSNSTVSLELVDTIVSPPADSASVVFTITDHPITVSASGFDFTVISEGHQVRLKARHQPKAMAVKKTVYRANAAYKKTSDKSSLSQSTTQKATQELKLETRSRKPPWNPIAGIIVLALLFSGIFFFKKRA